MTIGLVGKKCGMTRIFTPDGASIPVTVIEIQSHRITQVKTEDTHGYSAIQVTTGNRKRSALNKPVSGHYAAVGVEPGELLKEFRVEDQQSLDGLTVGSELTVNRFTVGQYVDVSGVTKGKGFAGVVKRHHFNTQDATHGNSLSHRVPGSIGQRQSPGKVFKGKRMAGHMGNKNRTILSQEVIHIDTAKNLLLVKGAIPGAVSQYVIVRPAVKKQQ